MNALFRVEFKMLYLQEPCASRLVVVRSITTLSFFLSWWAIIFYSICMSMLH